VTSKPPAPRHSAARGTHADRNGSGPHARRRLPAPVWVAAAILLACLFAAWSWRAWITAQDPIETEITALVARGDLPVLVSERGDLESSKTVEVRCEVEGEQIKITEAIPDGSRVTKGQLVLRFDTEKLSRTYAEQEVKWRTSEAKAKAAAEDLEVARNKAESEVAKAELAVKLAKIDLRKYLEGEYIQDKRNYDGEVLLAEEEMRRAEERLHYSERLNKKGYISSGEVEADRVAVTKTKNALITAQEKLRVLQEFSRERQLAELNSNSEETERELARTRRSQASAVAKAESDLQGAAATAAVEKTLLDRTKHQLDRGEVTAPEDGILVYDRSRPWDTASRIQPGGVVHFQRVLFSLPDLAQMQVKVKIHESSVKKVKAGQEAEIRVDAYPDAVLLGTVERVATLADNRGFWDQRGVKEYESIVKIRDVPADAGLKPGMTAEIKIHVNHLSDVLLVPIQSVAEKDGQRYSFVVSGTSIERRAVEVGENNDQFVQIQHGLEEGDRVTLDARARLDADSKSNGDIPKRPPVSTSTAEPPGPGIE
jgi:RND family efflux transporter MFP subunit